MQVSKQTEITKLDIQVNKMDAEQRLGETHLTAGVTLHLLKGEMQQKGYVLLKWRATPW